MKYRLFCFTFILGCGLFHRGVPKKGEFCNVLVKPPTCLFVDFEKQKLIWDGVQYDLALRTRMEYLFTIDNVKAELLVTTENRIDIKIPGESIPKFYMRKKEKFSTFPESKE